MSRVLLVDDDPSVIDGLRRALRRQGLEADLSGETSGIAAIDRLRQEPADVVVADVRMPGMDGVELLARLKSDAATQQIPVIMLTGHDDAEARRAALGLGALDFVNKPADVVELTARIRNALRLSDYRRTLDRQKRELEAQLERAQRAETLGMIAGGVLHDLKNFLLVVSANMELATRKLGDDSAAAANLGRALAGCQNACALARRALTLAKGTDGEGNECDLIAVVPETIELLRPSTGKDIQIQWAPTVNCCLVALDHIRVSQVMLNLGLNAIQALKGSGTLEVSIDPSATKLEDPDSIVDGHGKRFVCLTVTDSGCGMDETTRKHLFEPLYTTKSRADGTGLGLSVVHRIVTGVGGSIAVESTPGEGTTFRVYLPGPRDGGALERPVSAAAEAT